MSKNSMGPSFNKVRAGYAANRQHEDGTMIVDAMVEFDKWFYSRVAEAIRAEADAIEESERNLPGMTVGDVLRGLRLGARDWEDVAHG